MGTGSTNPWVRDPTCTRRQSRRLGVGPLRGPHYPHPAHPGYLCLPTRHCTPPAHPPPALCKLCVLHHLYYIVLPHHCHSLFIHLPCHTRRAPAFPPPSQPQLPAFACGFIYLQVGLDHAYLHTMPTIPPPHPAIPHCLYHLGPGVVFCIHGLQQDSTFLVVHHLPSLVLFYLRWITIWDLICAVLTITRTYQDLSLIQTTTPPFYRLFAASFTYILLFCLGLFACSSLTPAYTFLPILRWFFLDAVYIYPVLCAFHTARHPTGFGYPTLFSHCPYVYWIAFAFGFDSLVHHVRLSC